ncbi:MAG: SMC-Scp complex subunit ScpB [Nanoarchaeota archaeon]|jgi:segregation and condensation protein B|nr:SMC-Scp complex subunit ScpB [Nanoarchaeota archaeon]
MEISGKTLEDIDWSRENENIRLVEAVLFVAGRFLSMADLITYSGLNSLVILEVLKKLKEKYNKEDSAIELVERDKVWKMDVKAEYSNIVNKLATGSVEFTKAEQQTLGIIAYKQPIKQSVIIKIRGNKAYDHVHKFLQLGLIKSKKDGHTNILGLTDEFYDYFNISGTGDSPLKETPFSDDLE